MLFIMVLFCGAVLYLYQSLWGPGLQNSEDYTLYIPSGASYDDVKNHLSSEGLVKNMFLFDQLADVMKYKKGKVKAGRYIIKPQTSIRDLLTKLRSGNQDATKVTFNTIRTIQELAGNVSKQIEADSISLLNTFLSDENVQGRGLTPESAATLYIPNTYEVYWNISPDAFVNRMADEHEKFWSKNDRRAKAEKLGLSPTECNILASIVQKESNRKDEQLIIAGVYLNRIKKGMPLQADPTVVFAVGDFTIKRVLNKHLLYKSPYNTYLNTGLPPGPISVAETTVIDAVLNAEDHKYLYFCAKPGYDGGHLFAKNLIDHNKNARIYHRWLSREGILK